MYGTFKKQKELQEKKFVVVLKIADESPDPEHWLQHKNLKNFIYLQGRSERGTVHAGVAPRAHRYKRGLHQGDTLIRIMLLLTDETMKEDRSNRQNNFLNSWTVLRILAIFLARIRILSD
jgi:hypothetical protein